MRIKTASETSAEKISTQRLLSKQDEYGAGNILGAILSIQHFNHKKFSDIFFKNSHVSSYSLLDYIFAGLVKIHSLRAEQNYGNSQLMI